MKHDFTYQPKTPIEFAMKLLREETHGILTAVKPETADVISHKVQIASEVSGQSIVAIPDSITAEVVSRQNYTVTLILGSDPYLSLPCIINEYDDTEYPIVTARFKARHGDVPRRFDIFRLISVNPILVLNNQTFRISDKDLYSQFNKDLMALERRAVDHMNEDHLDAIKLYAEVLLGKPVGSWRLASLDMDGLDLIHEELVARLWFQTSLREPDDIKKRLIELVHLAREMKSESV